MHVNMSLKGKDGKNAFFDENDPLQLSEQAYSFIAGIMAHIKGMAAVTNPLVNSYKRLVPGYEAPVHIAWSAQNRSPLIRIPTSRAPDYDDWKLNGDILVWYEPLKIAFEISSMGIRVDEKALLSQLEERGCSERADLPFQKSLLEGRLPYTVGGGIGQSRLCMFFLKKAHIGEVQVSVWDDFTIGECTKKGVMLL